MDHQALYADVKGVLDRLPATEVTTAQPTLIVISGLPGSGKSFFARRLAERLPAVIVESDYVRKLLFRKPTYSGTESAWVHRVARAAMRSLLRSGHHVINDATNLAEWQRTIASRLADQTGAKLVIVRTVAPEAVIRKRLHQRFQHPDPQDSSDANWEIYEHYKSTQEAVRRPHLVVNTTQDMDQAVQRIVRAVRGRARA